MKVVYREETDRWIKGDRHVRPLLRRLLRRNPPYASGMQTVVANFRKGLERRHIAYSFNPPAFTLRRSDKVISFGLGLRGLAGVKRETAVIAAIGFPHPAQLPRLCEDYNIKRYLQHSQWVLDLVRSANVYMPEVFDLWPAGIDVEAWQPGDDSAKSVDVLIYRKLLWNPEEEEERLVQPIREHLALTGRTCTEIAYRAYSPDIYRRMLDKCRVMIFLSPHESQGLAYQECLASNVPVLAWDQGSWLDPSRFALGRPHVPATSVPFFDERCGDRFVDGADFAAKFEDFFARHLSGRFRPREYILENLTIDKSTARMLDIFRDA